MPRPRFHKLSSEKQGRIVAAAIAEFSRAGYAHASLNRIIAEAGVSKGAMYYYFDGKADIYAMIMSQMMTRFLSVVGSPKTVDSADAFWPEVEKIYVRTLSAVIDDPDLVKRHMTSDCRHGAKT